MTIRAPWVRLAQLRSGGRRAEREWLRSVLQQMKRDEVRDLAQEAGLRVRTDDNVTWLSVGDLRAALLEHLAPARWAVPLELPWHLFLCLSFVLDETVKHLFNMSSSHLGSKVETECVVRTFEWFSWSSCVVRFAPKNAGGCAKCCRTNLRVSAGSRFANDAQRRQQQLLCGRWRAPRSTAGAYVS